METSQSPKSEKLESKLLDTLKYDIAPHLALNALTFASDNIPLILGGLAATSSYYLNLDEFPSRVMNNPRSLFTGTLVTLSTIAIFAIFAPNSKYISKDFKIGTVESREFIQHSKFKLATRLNTMSEFIKSKNLYETGFVRDIQSSQFIRTKFETGYCVVKTNVSSGSDSFFNLDNQFSVQDGSKTSTQYSNSLFGPNNSLGTSFKNDLLTQQQRSDAILCRDFIARNSKELKSLKKVFPKHMEPLK